MMRYKWYMVVFLGVKDICKIACWMSRLLSLSQMKMRMYIQDDTFTQEGTQ